MSCLALLLAQNPFEPLKAVTDSPHSALSTPSLPVTLALLSAYPCPPHVLHADLPGSAVEADQGDAGRQA